MVDNWSDLNIVSKHTPLTIGLSPGHLKRSSLVIQWFNQTEQRPQNTDQDTFERDQDFTEFMVIVLGINFNALLGHLWMHENAAVPSSYLMH